MTDTSKALPCRGLLSSQVLDFSRPAVYIADHETRAPSARVLRPQRHRVFKATGGQVLKFDKQPLLLRQLQSRKDAESRARRKQQEGGKAKPAAPQKAAAAKRAGENLPTPDAKRAQTEGQSWTPQKLITKTKTELVEILKTSGQKTTGKKEELMARIMKLQRQ